MRTPARATAMSGFVALLLLTGAASAHAQADQDAPASRRSKPASDGEAPDAATEGAWRHERRDEPARGTRRGAASRVATPIAPLPPPAHVQELAPAPPGRIEPQVPFPADPQAVPIAIVGATVHTVSGATIAGGTVVFEQGRITAVGPRDVPVPAEGLLIDATGLHVYPSLFSADTTLGLVEIGAVRATRDVSEAGEVNPNARAEVAVNPDSELLPVARSNGVLVAVTAPRGGLVSGTGAVLGLDGWTWEDLTIKAPAGLWVTWPQMALDRSPAARVPIEKQERDRDLAIEKLKEAFATARAYAAGQVSGPAKDRDVKWAAMARAAKREIPVVVRADDVLQIKAALRFAEEEKLRLVLAGGRDAPLVADALKRRGVAVLLGNVMSVGRPWDPYDVNFATPLALWEAGVPFCITSDGDSWNVRNLPYIAAKAVAYGLPAEIALRAITLSPARIFEVDDRLGSLEPGKDATLFLADGDILDGRSNVLRAFLRGRELDLSDRHKRLYERYRLRPRRDTAGTDAAAPQR